MGRLSVTTGGDGLKTIQPPADAFLYEPPSEERQHAQLLRPSESGLDPRGTLYPVTIVQTAFGPKNAGVTINPVPDVATGIEGCWICLERSRFQNEDELYFFELREFEVRSAEDDRELGRLIELQDTAAHGILVIETATGDQIMIPNVDAYVEIDRENKLIRIKDFDDFRI